MKHSPRPNTATAGTRKTAGCGTVTILEADALSGDDGRRRRDAAGSSTAQADQRILAPPEDRARAFGCDQFTDGRRHFPSIHFGWCLYHAAPPLRQALEVVRWAAAGSPVQRRAAITEAAIRATAMSDEADEAVLGLVVETPAWSEKRVVGLSL